MTWVRVSIVVPDNYVVPARIACETLAGVAGSGMFSTPLSETGTLPATHWISFGMIEEEFYLILSNNELLEKVAIQNNIDSTFLKSVVNESHITLVVDSTLEEILSNLNLKMVTE